MKSRSYGSYRIHHNNEVDGGDKDFWVNGSDDASTTMAKPAIRICKSDEELARFLGFVIEKKSNEAIRKTQRFTVAVSGGSLPKILCETLPSLTTDWSKWVVFFCDERLVPFNDPESTYGVYKEKLLGVVPIQDEQIIKINPDLSAADAASDYSGKIANHFPDAELPKFDMLLLGMGPDGHTCSLFPNHPLLKEQGLWVAPITDSPKPPPCRVTFTLPVINNASSVVFVCTGSSKAEVVKQVLEDPENRLPAALVRPVDGELHWILDQGASQLLTKE